MTTEDLVQITKAIANVIRDQVASAFVVVLDRVKAFESRIDARIDAMPRPEKGDKGEQGEKGERGERGEAGKDASPFTPEHVAFGEVVERVLGLLPAPKDGAPGKDGIDGKDGKDAEPIDLEAVAKRAASFVAAPLIDHDAIAVRAAALMPKPKDGINAPPVDIDAVAEKAAALVRVPKDGKDGHDGAPGRDGVDVDILPSIDFDKSYPRGTFASWKGGLWRSFRTTTGTSGWDCIVPGVAELKFEKLSERNFALVVELSTGPQRFEFSMPTLLERGVFREGVEYEAGDGVTFGGAYWIAQSATRSKPGEDTSWRLAVKSGRNGKDGRDAVVDMLKRQGRK